MTVNRRLPLTWAEPERVERCSDDLQSNDESQHLHDYTGKLCQKFVTSFQTLSSKPRKSLQLNSNSQKWWFISIEMQDGWFEKIWLVSEIFFASWKLVMNPKSVKCCDKDWANVCNPLSNFSSGFVQSTAKVFSTIF